MRRDSNSHPLFISQVWPQNRTNTLNYTICFSSLKGSWNSSFAKQGPSSLLHLWHAWRIKTWKGFYQLFSPGDQVRHLRSGPELSNLGVFSTTFDNLVIKYYINAIWINPRLEWYEKKNYLFTLHFSVPEKFGICEYQNHHFLQKLSFSSWFAMGSLLSFYCQFFCNIKYRWR